MGYLSWLFFCLSPFALFCSEDGNGLILCPVFILLGFVFKWIGNNSNGAPTAVVKVEPQKFWEWHYKDRMRSALSQKDSISDNLMAYKDKEARRWATTICGYHNAWVPPEEKQEQIARANGVITEQMVKEKTVNKDRIQIGKFFLMEELMKKYGSTKIGEGGKGGRCCFPRMKVKGDIYKIRTTDGSMISDYWTKREYNKSMREIWESLSDEEKNQATIWVEEYEKKLTAMIYEYVEERRDHIVVEMDF